MTAEPDTTEEGKSIAGTSQSGPDDPRPASSVPSSEHHHPNAAGEGQNTKQNNKHWLEYAAALFAFIATLGSVSAGVVGYRQWDVLHAQQTIMQRQLDAAEADQRAWLRISASPNSLKFDPESGAATVQYSFEIRNVGHSVAKGARVEAKVIVFSFGEDALSGIMKKQEDFCSERIANKATENMDKQNMGIVLFPGEAYPADGTSYGGADYVTKSQILDSVIIDVNNGRKTDFFAPFLIGCVIYRLNLTEEHHQTGFIYQIGRTDPINDRKVPLAIKIGTDLAPPDLVFESWFHGSGKLD